MKLRKTVGLIGGPAIGTFTIALFFLVNQILFPNEHIQGTDEVARAFFYFILIPVFLFIGIMIQIFLAVIVYNDWRSGSSPTLKKVILLYLKLIVFSTLLTSLPLIPNGDYGLKSVLFIFILYVIYYSLSQTFYLFTVKIFPLKKSHPID